MRTGAGDSEEFANVALSQGWDHVLQRNVGINQVRRLIRHNREVGGDVVDIGTSAWELVELNCCPDHGFRDIDSNDSLKLPRQSLT